MASPLRIIVPTDVFPPHGTGGAAWSSFALSQALTRRGHDVVVVVPRRGGGGVRRRQEQEVTVVEVGYRAPGLPFVQNAFRFELLWPRLARQIERLANDVARRLPLVIHGQHAQTIPAAVLAGQRLGAPSLGTVRDYWPLHYFATGLLGDRVPIERFGLAASALDLLARLGPLRGLPSLLALPYVQRHVRRRAELLAQASAVVAVSGYVAQRLAPIVPPERIRQIPNPVDLGELDRLVAGEPETRVEGPFVLYAGKLERNKGADMLPAVVSAALQAGAQGWTLVIAGKGALRPALERDLARLDLPVRFLDWASHDEVLRLMARCAALVFPSGWAEPLTRVLVEAAAVGAPIVALTTGGTGDIVRDGVGGLLAHTAAGLGRALASLLLQPALAERLGRGARRHAEAHFAAASVAARHESLYYELLGI